MTKTLSIILFIMVFLILIMQSYLVYLTINKESSASVVSRDHSVQVVIELMDKQTYLKKNDIRINLYDNKVDELREFILRKSKNIIYLSDLTLEINSFNNEKEAKSFLIELKKMDDFKQILLREEIK